MYLGSTWSNFVKFGGVKRGSLCESKRLRVKEVDFLNLVIITLLVPVSSFIYFVSVHLLNYLHD